MENALSILLANAENFEELYAFYIRMNEVINSRNSGFNPNNPVFPEEDTVKDAIKNGGQIIATFNGKIVAAAIVNGRGEPAYNRVKWNIPAAENEFWVLHALRVAPEYEGRGIARQMLAFITELAQKRGIKSIRLDVLEGYSVAQLYLNFGFKYVDTVEMLYADIGYTRRFDLLEKQI